MKNKNIRQAMKQVEDLILETIYHSPHTTFSPDSLKAEISRRYNKKFNEPLDEKIFDNVLRMLIGQEMLELESQVIPYYWENIETGEKIRHEEKIETLRITAKGITKILDKKIKQIPKEFNKQLANVLERVDIQSRDVSYAKERIIKIEKMVNDRVKEIENIKNEFDRIRSEFYGRILQIFGIFVAIFSFIIVGFTQIPQLVRADNDWLTNFLNVSTVFIPLIIVLGIILFSIWWITRRIK